MTLPLPINQFDALISLLGAMGLLPVIYRLWRQEYLNPVEQKLRILLVYLFFVFVVRVPYLGLSIGFFGGLTYLVAMLFAFSVLLYFETLLRRHFPLWFKLVTSLGFLFFAGVAATGQLHKNKENLIYFGIFILSCQAVLVVLCLARDRKSLTRIENSIVTSNLLSLIVLVPLFLSDIGTYGVIEIPRLGTVGGLILAYVSLYNQALFVSVGTTGRAILKSVGASILLTAMLSILFSSPDRILLYRCFELFLCLSMIFQISMAVRSLDGSDDISKFLRAVHETDKKKLSRFLLGVNDFFSRLEKRLVKPAELTAYNREAIRSLFDGLSAPVLSIYQLQEMLEDEKSLNATREKLEACEQLIDLLEKAEMSHLFRAHREQETFVLFHVPMVGYHNLIELKTSLVADLANLIK